LTTLLKRFSTSIICFSKTFSLSSDVDVQTSVVVELLVNGFSGLLDTAFNIIIQETSFPAEYRLKITIFSDIA